MDQTRRPIFEALVEHAHAGRYDFHVPGHKHGRVLAQSDVSEWFEILKLDVTEITGMDDLHAPKGIIKNAEKLTAAYYNTIDTSFLVGGSTVGILAMILAHIDDDDVVLVQRDCHQSVLHALELARGVPVMLSPDIDRDTGLSLGISLETLEEGFAAFPKAKAVVLTNPSYEGVGQALDEHVHMAHQFGSFLFVDEAHGAHLKYGHRAIAASSLDAGADAVVQSAHKMLPAMTMASYLHINTERVNLQEVKRYLRMLQSSSPSYPLLASLDIARYFIANLPLEDMERVIRHWYNIGKELAQIEQLDILEVASSSYWQDPFKCIIAPRCSLSGIELKSELEKQGVDVEMATLGYIVLTFPLTVEGYDGESIVETFRSVLKNEQVVERSSTSRFPFAHRWVELAPFAKAEGDIEYVPISSAVGRLMREVITPYPPGIPLLLPGERVTEQHVEQLQRLEKQGARFQTGESWMESGVKVDCEC
ncbi:aminotransferase class I/II-fold pyridoxal phosphate-dependent enzyme [Texcoconibacillus texcoconensis]|uniref:aminotransferase class I/II-fold pyridoxal phosphate-dependent enzyme n=1 Tax=Texcoconibacillus texcoconensis TaxID=1095777 RepID=UPI00161DFD1B|nr:aminotransferase class I/II-fold pyridoxal phosphate-dependent enzyme [Texcoconibacillus texcoconensis]